MLPLLLPISFVALSSTAPMLDLEPGKVQGFEYKTDNNDAAEIFLNIPYASPPIGELRFEKPQPVPPWQGIRNGTIFGPNCIQLVPSKHASENCLTLNIIRPKLNNQTTSLPILLWIHGGGYEVGSAFSFGYEGFFSTGDKRMPGNLGLYDMTEALKFVHKNAKHIGGDPLRITVWGHSAGSAAAGQLILSPKSRDYIAQSIEMSGSPYGSWAIGAGVANNSLELAKISTKMWY
ncbi:unnamed protein product [Strongylus vulgaris]|uniref:Carboxylesterase type B domain-containing protein n=1 Tax=Strongylus vulgaris TaxID=40348 RepID=A0A3P7IP86_STRVU|nr:unnamed protein product [Strongylus vulgaris]